MSKKIEVVELFAGVGGFRLGLEGYKGKSATSKYRKILNSNFKVVWSNQWEPSTITQHANFVYKNIWPNSNHSEENIENIVANKKSFKEIPPHDLLVGGFPCQDYSVASLLKNSKGLIGQKGVLWWSIYKIISNKKIKPKYLFLENVDRLLVSPSSQRGRDFAVMLSCLYEQGYAVEWKIINAADYSMPQRRRRLYLLAYHKTTDLFKKMKKIEISSIILNKGVISDSFNVNFKANEAIHSQKISKDLVSVSKNFNVGKKLSPFKNSGFMINGTCHTVKTEAIKTKPYPLKKVLQKNKIDSSFYIDFNKKIKREKKKQVSGKSIIIKTHGDKWKYLKGKKREWRTDKNTGYKYKWGEGKMEFPDLLNQPSRTIITAEGGSSPSRFKHVIEEKKGVYRRLTPIELEKLNMFPKNHTKHEKVSDSKRAFFMGNALVVGIVEKIGKSLIKYI
tara:strand:- start:99 stop:1445 length:1347 start_codon:yes stop_codon:yes gene_type:complete